MSDEEDLNAQRTRMMEIWHEYGKTFNVFVPAEQPVPRIWDGPLQEPDDQSRWNPQTIKHWRFFELTKRLLRKRYRILSGPALTFGCEVPRFQERLSQYKPKPRERLHQNGDPLVWYADVLEMFITSQDEVGFDCHSTVCLRTRCKLNIRNPDRISPVDIFSLIQIFHGFRSVNQAIRIVSEELGSIDRFVSSDVRERDIMGTTFFNPSPNHLLESIIIREGKPETERLPGKAEIDLSRSHVRNQHEWSDPKGTCRGMHLEHGPKRTEEDLRRRMFSPSWAKSCRKRNQAIGAGRKGFGNDIITIRLLNLLSRKGTLQTRFPNFRTQDDRRGKIAENLSQSFMRDIGHLL